MADITSNWVISVTVDKLRELNNLRKSLEGVMQLASKGKPKPIRIDVDVTQAEKKLDRLKKKYADLTIKAEADTKGSGRASTSQQNIKLDVKELRATFTAFDKSVARFVLAAGKLGSLKLNTTVKGTDLKLDTKAFASGVSEFVKAVSIFARAAKSAKGTGPTATASRATRARATPVDKASVSATGKPLYGAALASSQAKALRIQKEQEAAEKAAAKALQIQKAEGQYEARAVRAKFQAEAAARAEDRRREQRNTVGQKQKLNAAVAEAELQSSLRGFTSQSGFATFGGRNAREQALSFSSALNRSLSSLSSAVEGYTRRLALVEESPGGSGRILALRGLARQNQEVGARSLVVSKLIDQGAALGLPGVSSLQDINRQYQQVRTERIRQQTAIAALENARTIAANPEVPHDVRARFGAFATRQEARLNSLGINNNTLRETIALEGQLEKRLLAGASAFAVNTRAVIAHRGAIEHFFDRVRALARFVGAGYIVFGLSAAITGAIRQAIGLEAVFTRIQGILPGRSLSQRLQIESGVIKAAQDFGTSLTEAADVAKTLAQTGLHSAEVVKETRAILAATVGGGIEKGQAVETAVAVRNISGGRTSSDDIFSRIARVESQQAATGQDLAVAVQRIGSLFQELNPTQLGTVDAFDALLGTATEIVQTTRVSGNQAATALKLILSRLSLPNVTRNLQGNFGIKLAGAGGVGARPVTDILSDIAAEFQRLKETGQGRKAQELLVTVAGGRQLGLAAALFENFNRAMQIASESSLAFGDIQKRTKLQMETLETKFTQLSSAFTAFIKALGENSGLFAGLKGLLDALTKLLNIGQKHPVVGTIGTVAGGILGFRALRATARGIGGLFGAGRVAAGVAEAGGVASEVSLLGRVGGLFAGLRNFGLLARLTSLAFGGLQVAGIAVAIGVFAYALKKLFASKADLDKYAKYTPLTAQDLQESAVGQDLRQYSKQLGTSQIGLVSGTNLAAAAARARLLREFPKEGENLFQFDAEGRAAATNPKAFTRFMTIFREEMVKAIPGLKDIKDQSEQTAIAMKLFNRSIQVGSFRGESVATDINTNFENLSNNLNTSLESFLGGTIEQATKSVSIVRDKDAAVRAARLGIPYSPTNVNDALRGGLFRDNISAQVGFGLTRDILKTVGATTTAAQNRLVQQQLQTLFNADVGGGHVANFGGLLAVQNVTTITGKVVKALDYLRSQIEDKGQDLGTALDSFARDFLTITGGKTGEDLSNDAIAQSNRARLVLNLESQLDFALKASKNQLTPKNPFDQGVGGQYFVQTYLSLLSEAATNLAEAAKKSGQTPAARENLNIAKFLEQVGNREKTFAATEDAARNRGRVLLRDRLVDLLGEFAVREERILNLSSAGRNLAGRTGRAFDINQERISSIENLVDGLAGLGSRIQLDILKYRANLSKTAPTELVQEAVDRFSEDSGIPTPTALTAFFQKNKNITKNPQFEAILADIQTSQSALRQLVVSPGEGKDLLKGFAPEEREFLLKGLFSNVTKENADKILVIMQTLFEAAVKLEQSRRNDNIELEKKLALQKELQEAAETELRFNQQLAQVGRSERIRQTEILGRQGSLGSLSARAADLPERQLEAVQAARLVYQNRVAAAEADRARNGEATFKSQLTAAGAEYRKAIAEANNEATLNLAQLLADERTNLLQAEQEAITQATESGLSGLREILSSYKNLTSGNFFERLLGPIADTLTQGFSQAFLTGLTGPGGLIEKQVRDLFGAPVRLQFAKQEADLQSAILYAKIVQAHIDGVNKAYARLGTPGQTVIGINGQPVSGIGTAATPLVQELAGSKLAGLYKAGLPVIGEDVFLLPQRSSIVDTQAQRLSSQTTLATGAIGFGGVANDALGALNQASITDAAGKRKLDPKQLEKAAEALIGSYVGAYVGGAISGKGVKNSYASEGAAIGTAAGSFLPIPGGTVIGGFIGGAIGGLFGKGQPDREFAVLDKIERGQRAVVTAIENQTRQLLSVDSRLFNVPASFVLPAYRPLNSGPGNTTAGVVNNSTNITVVVNGTAPSNLEQQVANGVRKGLRGEGTFSTPLY